MTKHKNYVRKYHPYYSKSVNIQLHPPDIILFFTRILAVVKIEKVSTLVLWSFPVNGTDHSLVYHKYFLLKINVGVSKHWSLLLSTWIVSSCSQWHIHSLGSDCGCHIWWLSHLVVVFQSWLQKKKNETKKGRIIFIVKFIPTIFVMHIHSISNQTVIQWSKSLPYLEIVWNKVWSTSSKLYQS